MKKSTFSSRIIAIIYLILIIGCKTPVTIEQDGSSNANPNSPEIDLPVSHLIETEMKYTRCNHTAVLMKDGRVFVVGGNDQEIEPSSEIFTPQKDSWSIGPKPLLNRRSAKSIILDDGRVVIIGGEYKDSQGRIIANRNIEIFDPVTNEIHVVAQQVLTANGASVTKLTDGKILILGGSYFDYSLSQQIVLKGAEIFDPVTNIVSPAFSQMAVARSAHTATLMMDNQRVIIIGGVGSYGVNARVEVFNINNSGITETNPLVTARFRHFTTIASDGRIVVIGGNNLVSGVVNLLSSFEAYMSYGAFEAIPASSINTFDPSYLSLSRGNILITGGRTASNGSYIRNVNIYDSMTNNINTATDMIQQRQGHVLTELTDGTVLAMGGANSTGCLKSAERLDLEGHE